jgi:hypothetical protein
MIIKTRQWISPKAVTIGGGVRNRGWVFVLWLNNHVLYFNFHRRPKLDFIGGVAKILGVEGQGAADPFSFFFTVR